VVPQPFAYEYGVKDEYTGAAYQKSETQNDYGVVQGSYKVTVCFLPTLYSSNVQVASLAVILFNIPAPFPNRILNLCCLVFFYF
jgi:hypothetical protein